METHETQPSPHHATETHHAHAPAHQALTIGKIVQFIKTKPIKIGLCSIAGLIVLLLVFGAGIEVGFHKAEHSFRWGENYHRNFGGPREGFMQDFGRLGKEDYMDSNGTVGQILKMDGQTITMKGKDNVEKLILTDEKTSIRSARGTIALAELKADDTIVVIGEPNNAGQIVAKFIRVMPAPQNQPAQGQPTPQP
jgi:hypothetical protein